MRDDDSAGALALVLLSKDRPQRFHHIRIKHWSPAIQQQLPRLLLGHRWAVGAVTGYRVKDVSHMNDSEPRGGSGLYEARRDIRFHQGFHDGAPLWEEIR